MVASSDDRNSSFVKLTQLLLCKNMDDTQIEDVNWDEYNFINV